jgi:hypothetical protein
MTKKICLLHHQNHLKNLSGVRKLPTEASVLPVRPPYRSLPFRSSRSSAPLPLIINRRRFSKDLEHTHPKRRKRPLLSMQEWWTLKGKISQLIRPSCHTKPCPPTKSDTSFRMTMQHAPKMPRAFSFGESDKGVGHFGFLCSHCVFI